MRRNRQTYFRSNELLLTVRHTVEYVASFSPWTTNVVDVWKEDGNAIAAWRKIICRVTVLGVAERNHSVDAYLNIQYRNFNHSNFNS